MMTVVAVIMILAALLLSTIGRTHERSIRVHCLSNIKQVDLLLLMYGHENNDRLPQTFSLTFLPQPLVEMVIRERVSHQIFYDPGIADQSENWFTNTGSSPREIGYCLALGGTFNLYASNVNTTIMPQPILSGTNRLLPPPNASQRVLVAGVAKVTPRLHYPLSAGDGSHLDSNGWIPGDSVAMLDGSAKWRKFRDMSPRTFAFGSPKIIYW
jgi:hypothetical protein